MEADERQLKPGLLHSTMIGFQLGILGGLIMLAWFMVACPVLGQPWWQIANLWASKHPILRFRLEAGLPTLYGAAIHLIVAGLVGAISGPLLSWSRLTGLLVAFLLYAALYVLWWRRIAPGLVNYSPQAVLQFGYFIYGSTLGLFPWLHRREWPSEREIR